MKHYVLKIEDIKNALPTESKDIFTDILHSIRKYRQILGKKKNHYLVVNIDEPYAVEIFTIMHRHGHTPCADCLIKETSVCDEKCVWSKLYLAALGVSPMQSRVCPSCGGTWYSAAAEVEWECPECGVVIPVEVSDDGIKDLPNLQKALP